MKKQLQDLVVLIPAYKPDEALVGFSKELLEQGFKDIIVVDDGGGEPFKEIFAELKAMGCTLLTHEVNKGKGRALKTAFDTGLREGRQSQRHSSDAGWENATPSAAEK